MKSATVHDVVLASLLLDWLLSNWNHSPSTTNWDRQISYFSSQNEAQCPRHPLNYLWHVNSSIAHHNKLCSVTRNISYPLFVSPYKQTLILEDYWLGAAITCMVTADQAIILDKKSKFSSKIVCQVLSFQVLSERNESQNSEFNKFDLMDTSAIWNKWGHNPL